MSLSPPALPEPAAIDAPVTTPLASALRLTAQQPFAGALTAAVYTDAAAELAALHEGAGVYDLGWRSRLRITGTDRVRWLNGMVTNTVKDLQPGQLNYTFLLNAQGRIQGDGDVYALPDALLLVTDCAQAQRLHAHLDHFIIMDDVELTLESGVTAIGLGGPRATALLADFYSDAATLAPGAVLQIDELLIARDDSGSYALWLADEAAPALWHRLVAAGAIPCGTKALEALRILSGVPRYGADIHDKSLAQETGQTRALNFNKGCYLGQEIVERVRSRATVHRAIRPFVLRGDVPAPGTALFAPEKPETAVGELTSVATVTLPGHEGTHALGTVRTEAAEATLHYAGGRATALAQPVLDGSRKV